MTFELSKQELNVLISAMNYMTKDQEIATGNPEVVNRLYNKLFTRHEYLEHIERNYTHDI